MIYPTPRLLQALLLGLLLSVAVSWQASWLPVWYTGIGGLLGLALIEALLLVTQKTPRFSRQVATAFPLGVWQTVEMTLTPVGKRRIRMEITEHVPGSSEVAGLPMTLTVTPGSTDTIRYHLKNLARGEHQINGCTLRLHGRLGLLTQRRFIAETSLIKVYPNFALVAKYAQLATDNRLSQLGIRIRQRRGDGMEFHQLREYRVGDSLRQVDWKATSRLRRLISREYHEERNQQVMMLLDTGFRMRAHDNDLSHFDHALNATLLLTHVVIRQGDAMGLMTFGGNDRFIMPAKGNTIMRDMMKTVFDLQPTQCIPDYLRAVQDISSRLKKRSLIVILTNLRDEDCDDLLEACQLLGKRHLVLITALRENLFDEIQQQNISVAEDAFTYAAAENYQELRQRKIHFLRHAGALVMDTDPMHLAARLINKYLDVKNSGRL